MKRLSMALVCLLFAASLFAQMPKPAPQLKELQPFIGNWDCKGELYNSPEFGPGHKIVATVSSKWILGNFWVSTDFKETKTKVAPEPFHGLIFLGYDGERKEFALGSLDNLGSYETAGATGWVGDTMTFEGPQHTGTETLTVRDAFTKSGTTKMSHVYSVKGKDGSWRKIEEDHCTRAK